MSKTQNTLAVFDLTISAENNTKDDIIIFFKEHCKKWAFQLEKGENTGYLHYQCRISLKVKKRFNTMISWINEKIVGCNVSPTSNGGKDDDFYAIKEDTRIDGPWTDKDEPYYLQKRFRGNITWKPWQMSLIKLINQVPDDRFVNVIVNKAGNKGKSFLAGHLLANKTAVWLPPVSDLKDMMRMVMNLANSNCYIIDLPRATSHRDQHAIYAGIESIKNGIAYDDRYHFQRKIFEPPHVFVFTNILPNIRLLSPDRWKLWTIKNDNLAKFSYTEFLNETVDTLDFTDYGIPIDLPESL